jgi:hypothetical protein
MSDEESNQQTTEDPEHSDEQPVGSEPAQESEAAEQPEEQSDEQSGENRLTKANRLQSNQANLLTRQPSRLTRRPAARTQLQERRQLKES